jgi:hypothetical protein
MGSQMQKGKAFEYACLKALKKSLHRGQQLEIETGSAVDTAALCYDAASRKEQEEMDLAAQAAMQLIARHEPHLGQAPSRLALSIQEDAKGIAGDVRDVMCKAADSEWEIGFSCKHNHTAVKHARLSKGIDFGEKWFGHACSANYFEEITPIFEKLEQDKQDKKKWSDMEEKEQSVYRPLLDAFIRELKALEHQFSEEVPKELVKYLLGRYDFYKVIANEAQQTTIVQAYNLYGTLSQAWDEKRPDQKIPRLPLPTKFYDISYKKNSNNTVIVTCDLGWAFSFRIHNASTYVEPSLKFDVRIVGMPPQLHTQVAPWEMQQAYEKEEVHNELKNEASDTHLHIRLLQSDDFSMWCEFLPRWIRAQEDSVMQDIDLQRGKEAWEEAMETKSSYRMVVATKMGRILSASLWGRIPDFTLRENVKWQVVSEYAFSTEEGEEILHLCRKWATRNLTD